MIPPTGAHPSGVWKITPGRCVLKRISWKISQVFSLIQGCAWRGSAVFTLVLRDQDPRRSLTTYFADCYSLPAKMAGSLPGVFQSGRHTVVGQRYFTGIAATGVRSLPGC